MDKRVIKPVPASGVIAIPTQAVIYNQPGVGAVIDYMTVVSSVDVKDPAILKDEAAAVMVSVFDGDKMVYAKPPPDGFQFVHEFAGTRVADDVDAANVDVDAVQVPLRKG